MRRRIGLLLGLLALAAVNVSSLRVRCFAADLSGVWVSGSRSRWQVEWQGDHLELRRTGADTYAATFRPAGPHSTALLARTAAYRDGVLKMDSPLYSSGAVRDRLYTVLTPKGVVLAVDPRDGDVLVPASGLALPSLWP